MNEKIITSRGLEFNVRTEKEGDAAIIEEVVDGDCYNLLAMKEAGFNPKTIFDIGASMGAFAKFAHSLFPNARIFCFEPNPRSFELLKKNCPFAVNINAAVRYDGANVLTDGEGATGGGFITTREGFESAASAKSDADHFIYSVVGEVKTTTIEAVCREHNIKVIDLLKIDCEGSEWDIFKGITTPVNKIIGEYHLTMGLDGTTFDNFKRLVFSATGKTIEPRRLSAIELFYTVG